MTTLKQVASASGLMPQEIEHWQKLVKAGLGYSRRLVPQKRRRPREVCKPSVGLDRVLKQLSGGVSITSGYKPQPFVHGFVKGRDIRTNASQHLAQDVVLRLDLRDFFRAVTSSKIKAALRSSGYDEEATESICGISLVGESLPQGFSTSPLLSNLAFDQTDKRLGRLAGEAAVSYTRYVDDLIFSGARASVNDTLLGSITALIEQGGWELNAAKTRFMRKGRPQYVTGLYVGDPESTHIPRSMKRLLRREVHFASKFGAEDARLNSPTPIDYGRLSGWIHYAAHVDPAFGSALRDSWRQVEPERSEARGLARWDAILDEIGFPQEW